MSWRVIPIGQPDPKAMNSALLPDTELRLVVSAHYTCGLFWFQRESICWICWQQTAVDEIGE